MSEYAFGDRVRFTWDLRRRSEHVEDDGRHCWRRFWTHVAYPGQPEPEPTSGIVIGKRTLANGEVQYDYEAGVMFDHARAERFTAYLIAFDLRRRPVYVLPEHIEREE